jgi:hypothetical protein
VAIAVALAGYVSWRVWNRRQRETLVAEEADAGVPPSA